jgi:hypothetical protein
MTAHSASRHQPVPLGGPVASDGPAKAAENTARAALDSRAGRLLTDTEWERSRTTLLEFMGILRDWDNNARKTPSEAGNVEVRCQRKT